MQNFQNRFNPYAQNVAIVKSYFKKPIVLIQGILYAVVIAFTATTAFLMTPLLGNYFDAIMALPGFSTGMSSTELDMFSMLTSVFSNVFVTASIVPSAIILGLTALAFIIIYKKSKNDNPDSVPTAGVTILFVLSIIQLVPIIISSVITLLAIVLFIIIGIVASADSGYVWGVIAAYSVIFGVMIAVMLLYYINQVRYYSSIRQSLKTVNLSYKGAGIFGVFSIIYGVYLALSSLSVFTINPIMSYMTELVPELELISSVFGTFSTMFIVSALSSIASAAVTIISGVIALGYKNHIKTYTEGFSEFGFQPSVAVEPVSANEFAPAVAQQQEPTLWQTENEIPQPAPQPQPQHTETQFEPVIFNDGTGIVQAPHCPRCGTPAKNGDVFCKACGTKL